MALRLARKLSGPRKIDLGYGVEVEMGHFGYADFKRAEAAAMRISEEQRKAADAAVFEAIDDEDMPPEMDDQVRGDFAATHLTILILRHGIGWSGIEADDGTPAKMTRTTVSDFLDLFPGAAQVLAREIMAPFHMLVSEGNASAPSPSTGTPEA